MADITIPSFLALQSDASFVAGGENEPQKMRISLFTGKPVAKFGVKLGIELEGIEAPEHQIPALFNHDPLRPIGFSNSRPSVVPGEGLVFEGTLLKNEDAQFIAEQAEQGLQWQASMGIKFSREDVELLTDGEEGMVNGFALTGPALVVRKAQLMEASVVTLGADDDTESKFLSLSDDSLSFSFDAKETLVSESKQTDVRAELGAFLAAFPGREGWAANQFAAGLSVVEAKAKLADEIEAQLKASQAEVAELHGRLEAVSQTGFQGATPAPAVEPVKHQLMNLSAMPTSRLQEVKLDSLTEMLSDDWASLSGEEKFAFGEPRNYAAYRRAEALGRVRVKGI